jgi:hypothetical protein
MERDHDISNTVPEQSALDENARQATRRISSEESSAPKSRLGSLSGQIIVPDDFDTMCSKEIEAMFYDSGSKPQPDDSENHSSEARPAES